MPNESKKIYVGAVIAFLKNDLALNTMNPHQNSCVLLAVENLQKAYEVGGMEQAPQPTEETNEKKIDLLKMFEAIYIERNPLSLALPAEKIKNQGNIFMYEGHFNAALLQYTRAINFNPKNPILYCNRAAAYIRLGDHPRAVIDCKVALLYDPNNSRACGRLGNAYANLGKYEEARAAYTKAVQLDPDNQEFHNNLLVIVTAYNQSLQNEVAQLTAEIDQLLSNGPNHMRVGNISARGSNQIFNGSDVNINVVSVSPRWFLTPVRNRRLLGETNPENPTDNGGSNQADEDQQPPPPSS